MSDLLRLFADNLLPILLVAGAGYLAGKWLNVEARSLSRVVFYLFSPCLLFELLVTSQINYSDMLRMVGFAAGLYPDGGCYHLAAGPPDQAGAQNAGCGTALHADHQRRELWPVAQLVRLRPRRPGLCQFVFCGIGDHHLYPGRDGGLTGKSQPGRFAQRTAKNPGNIRGSPGADFHLLWTGNCHCRWIAPCRC